MNNKKKIIKYLEGELSGEDLILFEKELVSSPELKKEIDSYRSTLDKFKNLKDTKGEQIYFADILPRFRSKTVGQKKYTLRPAFAAGSIIILLLVIIFFIIYSPNEISEDHITFDQLTNEELNEYLSGYSNDISTSQLIEDIPEDYDSVFSSMVENELNIDMYPEDYFVDVSNNEFYNIIDELSEEEIEGIYNTVLKRNSN